MYTTFRETYENVMDDEVGTPEGLKLTYRKEDLKVERFSLTVMQ